MRKGVADGDRKISHMQFGPITHGEIQINEDGQKEVYVGFVTQDYNTIVSNKRETHGGLFSDHPELYHRKGDFRYRPDLNVVFWWGLPTDEKVTDAVNGWVKEKFGKINVRHTSIRSNEKSFFASHGKDIALEVRQKDIKSRHPQFGVDIKDVDMKKLTLDNLKALRDKMDRAYRYSMNHEDDVSWALDAYKLFDDEIKKRLVYINEPVDEGYGAGNPDDDPKIPKGKRWTVKFDSTSKILKDEEIQEMVNEALDKVLPFSERYGGASKERGIWYHGTSKKRVPLIMSRGLDPNISPKNKSWGVDSDIDVLNLDKTSYGGIYVTQNIMTATSSALRTARKDNSTRALVVLELQPRSLTADEDDFASRLKDLKGNLAGSVYHSIYPYMWEVYGAPSYHKESHEKSKNEWVQNAVSSLFYSFEVESPQLKEVVKKMLEDEGYRAMLTRMVSYVEKGTWGDWWEWRRAYADANGLKDHGEEVEIPEPPTKSEGERVFRSFIDKLTRTMKHKTRHQFTGSFSKTGRSLQPIGFSGKNRIIAIVELVPSKNSQYRESVHVIYGSLPEDFKNQWQERIGELEIV